MTGRRTWLAVLAILAVLTAACGDSDVAADDQPGSAADVIDRRDGSEDADGSQDTSGGADAEDGNAASGDGGSAPDLDPDTMPPAGEIVFEVDGEAFSIRADAMDYFICELDEAFVNVRSESATQSVTVQVDTQSGRGNANLTAEGSDVRYDSFFGPETVGGAAVEAPHLLYEGRFDASPLGDPGDFSDVGLGRVSVTCP